MFKFFRNLFKKSGEPVVEFRYDCKVSGHRPHYSYVDKQGWRTEFIHCWVCGIRLTKKQAKQIEEAREKLLKLTED